MKLQNYEKSRQARRTRLWMLFYDSFSSDSSINCFNACAMNKLEQIDKNVTEIKSMLENLINEKNCALPIKRRLSMDEVAETIGDFFNVPLKLMRSDSREGHIMKARHMAKYIMLTEFHYTPWQIGEFIKCHRTSVYPTIKRTDNWLEVDAKYKKLHRFVMEEIAKKSKEPI